MGALVRKLGTNAEEFLDGRTLRAFEVDEGTVVGLVEQDRCVIDVFWRDVSVAL